LSSSIAGGVMLSSSFNLIYEGQVRCLFGRRSHRLTVTAIWRQPCRSGPAAGRDAASAHQDGAG
jgi:hypothetical protein